MKTSMHSMLQSLSGIDLPDIDLDLPEMEIDYDALMATKLPERQLPKADPNHGQWRERICIRLPHWLLKAIREQAQGLGIPYQTHLNNMLAEKVLKS